MKKILSLIIVVFCISMVSCSLGGRLEKKTCFTKEIMPIKGQTIYDYKKHFSEFGIEVLKSDDDLDGYSMYITDWMPEQTTDNSRIYYMFSVLVDEDKKIKKTAIYQTWEIDNIRSMAYEENMTIDEYKEYLMSLIVALDIKKYGDDIIVGEFEGNEAHYRTPVKGYVYEIIYNIDGLVAYHYLYPSK